MEPQSVASARALAQSCRSLDELERALTTFEGCPLAETATRLCFADGNRAASLMLVGEAPGAEEDRQGKPFVGPSGQLLDRMLAAVGLARSDTYITNLIYWRPPGNRSPTSSELATCLPFLERQIELLRPRLLVSVGGVAARVLLDLKDGVGKLRGRRFVYRPADGGEPVPTFVIFHPAYLLRQPLHKRLAWRDMLQLRAELRAQGGWPLEGGGVHGPDRSHGRLINPRGVVRDATEQTQPAAPDRVPGLPGRRLRRDALGGQAGECCEAKAASARCWACRRRARHPWPR